MKDIKKYLNRPIERIAIPTDFSTASQAAFAYALKLALICKAELDVLHDYDDADSINWQDFPKVRPLLQQWGLLEAGASRHAVAELGVKLSKIAGDLGDPAKFVTSFIKTHPLDLIVLSHHSLSQGGLLNRSLAEPISRETEELALLIPENCEGFIALDTGEINLKTILIPVDKTPNPQQAANAAMRSALILGANNLHFRLLHIEHDQDFSEDDFPKMHTMGDMTGWTWEQQKLSGNTVDTILSTAKDINADLIVMSTVGHDGFLDTLRGSVSEQIMRESKSPLLIVPERIQIS